MKGKIWFESEYEVGTTFFIDITQKIIDSKKLGTITEPIKSDNNINYLDLTGKRILIVDDNKGVLASLELLLETEFSEIKTAHHPNQITSILNTSPVDVIILDMNFSAGINNGNEGLYWLKR